ncbi:hypothetical protein OTU49_004598, partial [Cherax quadricarinatus]
QQFEQPFLLNINFFFPVRNSRNLYQSYIQKPVSQPYIHILSYKIQLFINYECIPLLLVTIDLPNLIKDMFLKQMKKIYLKKWYKSLQPEMIMILNEQEQVTTLLVHLQLRITIA